MNEQIRLLIKSKRPEMDDKTLEYFANYFTIVAKDELLPKDISIEDVINNALAVADKIVFYGEEDYISQKLGPDVKGFRDPDTHTLFVRNSLDDVLKEITIYHEIHHAAQTNIENDAVGINQEKNTGRLIMEAQTQYMAEKVYQEIHSVTFEDKKYTSEELRMSPGGTITSNLHNYQMYDNILSKLAIMLGVSKDYFVKINYLYKDSKGLEMLRSKYDKAKEKYEFPKDFKSMLLDLDYIYVVDYLIYIRHKECDVLLRGETTKTDYTISDNVSMFLSLKMQKEKLTYFDREYFFSLLSNGGEYREFAKYIVDDKNRALVDEFIGDKKKDVPTS